MANVKSTIFKKGGKQRAGRGFSRGELKKTGLTVKEALRLGIPVDLRRRTTYEENCEAVKRFWESKKAAAKPKKRGKSKS